MGRYDSRSRRERLEPETGEGTIYLGAELDEDEIDSLVDDFWRDTKTYRVTEANGTYTVRHMDGETVQVEAGFDGDETYLAIEGDTAEYETDRVMDHLGDD